MHGEPDVTIIIPAYNEEEELGYLLREILQDLEGKLRAEIIVVDDGSKDGTNIVAREMGVDVLSLQQNHGYGYALRAGLRYARGSVVVFLDADGQYDPADIPKLVDLIHNGYADVVYTSIYAEPGGKIPAISRVGNLLFSFWIKMILGVKVTDFNTGLKAIRRSVINDFDLKEDGSAITIELVAQAVARNKKIVEIPAIRRRRFQTRAKSLLDGFRILRRILKGSLT